MTYVFEKYLIQRKLKSKKDAPKFASDMDKKCREEGGYWVSMLDPNEFSPILKWLKEQGYHKSFLDVGCGCGDKLIEASEVFKSVKGIEISKSLADFARINMGKIPSTIFCMDAFEYDYSAEEVIFMFSPLINRTLLKQLYKKIILKMPKDSILIDANPAYMSFKSIQYFDTYIHRRAGYYIKNK